MKKLITHVNSFRAKVSCLFGLFVINSEKSCETLIPGAPTIKCLRQYYFKLECFPLPVTTTNSNIWRQGQVYQGLV
jgi:hypothetical protein